MNEEALLEKRSELRRSIQIMDWDKKRSQLNFSKGEQLKECKKELENVENALKDVSSVAD